MAKKYIIIFIALLIAGGFTYWFLGRTKEKENFGGTFYNTNETFSSSFGFAGLYTDRDFTLAKNLGATVYRQEIKWVDIEPKKNQFNWEKFDSKYEELQSKYGFEVVVGLRTGQNSWATSYDINLCKLKKDGECPDKNASFPPKDLEGQWNNNYGYSKSYYDFTYNLANHFKDKVNYFIIENEVNTLGFWQGTADQYMELRATAYKAIHDANPNGVVIDNGFASDVWDNVYITENFCAGEKEKAENYFRVAKKRTMEPAEIEETLKNPPIDCNEKSRAHDLLLKSFAEPTFDIASYHYYGPWENQEKIIDFIKGKMKNANYERPIMLTEGGFFDSLRLPSDSQVKQDVADDVIKMHVASFSQGVKTVFWYRLQEKPDSKAKDLNYKALYNSNGDSLLASEAYLTMTKKIANFSEAKKLETEKEIFCYEFKSNNKKIIVAWSDQNKEADLSSFFQNSLLTKTNIKGETTTAQKNSVNLNRSPIFLEEFLEE